MGRFILVAFVAAGCSAQWQSSARAMSVSQMPCTEQQVEVREVEMHYASWTWDARCKGVDYHCTSAGFTTTCRPAAELVE
jgi:hypothetical protein